MKTTPSFKTIYVAPLTQIDALLSETPLMDVFSNGDPQRTGITINPNGDESDDVNLSNREHSLWDEE